MSLFNFIALSLHASQYLNKINTIQGQELATTKIVNYDSHLLFLKPGKLKQDAMNNAQYQRHHLATESIYRFSRLNNINPSLLQELTSKYWEQTIFLSISNPTIQKYINQLSKQETVLAKSKKKKIVIDFTKALLYGHIDADSIAVNDSIAVKESLALKYIWKKGLNLRQPEYLNGLWKNKRSPSFPSKPQNILLKKLQNNQFPIFTVVNGFKQLVVAEPADKLVNRNNIASSVYEWYYDRFLWNKDTGGIYEGWFFINHQDAEEYKDHIAEKYTSSTKQNQLSIMPTGINFYYRLNRTAPPRTEFRLFPDLEEVANLLNNKAYRYNLIFDKKQNHGRSYFQGQPIYIIEPVTCKIKNNKMSEIVSYYYQPTKENNGMQYKAVFFNKDLALRAWTAFCDSNTKYNLPSQPILRVYNLEDFLKDHEKEPSDNFLLIPTQESYMHIKSKYSDREGTNRYQQINQTSSYLLTCKLWAKRLIWSLTSRQPPNW